MSKRIDPFELSGCGCIPAHVPAESEPEPGEGTLFFKLGSRRVAFEAAPKLHVVWPGTSDAEEFPALRWYGAVGRTRVEDRQFDFPAFGAETAAGMPHRVVYVGPIAELDDAAERERLAARFGSGEKWVVGWVREGSSGAPAFAELHLLADTFVAPAGTIVPERFTL